MKMFTTAVLPRAGVVPGDIEPLLAGRAGNPPVITVQPVGDNYDGITPVTLSVTATGDAPLTYQWYEGLSGDTSTPIMGATASTYDAEPVTETSYWVRVSNGVNPPADSDTAVVAIDPPVITVQPVGGEYDGVTPVTLSVTATGAGLTYQWSTGPSGTKDTEIPGATSSTYDAAPGEATEYYCTVTNEGGAVDSDSAMVTIAAPPLDPADFTSWYDAEDAHTTRTGSDIDAYLDQGSSEINCTNVFGGDNQQSGMLDGHKTSVGAVSNDNWYRSGANASGILAEDGGFFLFVVKPTSVAEIKILWALENAAQGSIYLFDDGGTKKVRAVLGSGGQQVTVTSGAVTLDAWHVITVRYKNQDVWVSVDGGTEVQATGTGGDVLAGRLAQRYQLYANGGGNCFQGSHALAATKAACPNESELAAILASVANDYPSAGL